MKHAKTTIQAACPPPAPGSAPSPTRVRTPDGRYRIGPSCVYESDPPFAQMLIEQGYKSTVDEDGRSNSSSVFLACVERVEGLIRSSAYDLISGRAGVVAGLVVAQLAYVFGLAPGRGWISVKERLPKPGVDLLVYTPCSNTSTGGPYTAVAMLNIDGQWEILRYFEARDQLGEICSVGHRRVDVRHEWHGLHVTHWADIPERPR